MMTTYKAAHSTVETVKFQIRDDVYEATDRETANVLIDLARRHLWGENTISAIALTISVGMLAGRVQQIADDGSETPHLLELVWQEG